jgi:hypothetical protein
MVFAEPRFVKTEAIQRDDALHVVFECHGGGLADGMKRGDENTET